jgi:hypothetical protein
MSRLSTRNAWLKVVRDTRCPDAARAKALAALEPPAGLELLRKLLAARDCPPKLRVAGTQLYAEAMSRRATKPSPSPDERKKRLEEIKRILG